MSNQLHDGEEQRRKQVKIRAPERLVEEFDEWCEAQGKSRSEALRQSMKARTERTAEYDTPRQPPTDNETLARAYRRLCALASQDGSVPAETAVTALASTLNLDKTGVKRVALTPLDQRGYINYTSNVYGSAAYEIAGWPSANSEAGSVTAD